MTTVGTRFFRSIRFALRGLSAVYQAEQNFRIQLISFVVVMGIAVMLRVRSWELIAITLAGGSVLVLECINSAVERLLDLVQPRLHGYVREIKDVMAAAVLIASVGATIVVLAILAPYLLRATS